MTSPETQLASFLAKYEPAVAKLGKALRAKLRRRVAGAGGAGAGAAGSGAGGSDGAGTGGVGGASGGGAGSAGSGGSGGVAGEGGQGSMALADGQVEQQLRRTDGDRARAVESRGG